MPRPVVPIIACAALCGCSSPPGGFHSPEPAARLDAIFDADRARDRTAIPDLIESLSHDDPLVRMAAINALKDITGETRGYRYWDAEDERRKAAEAWVDWYRQTAPAKPAPLAASAGAPIADKRGDHR